MFIHIMNIIYGPHLHTQPYNLQLFMVMNIGVLEQEEQLGRWWVRFLILKPRLDHVIPLQGSCPLCLGCFCHKDMQSGVTSEPVDRASHVAHPFLAKSRGKGEERQGNYQNGPWSTDPRDLNAKQMGPRHSSKSHTVLFSSLDTSFGHICLFFWKYSCTHGWRIHVHRQKYFLGRFWLFSQKERWAKKEESKSLRSRYQCCVWLAILALVHFLGAQMGISKFVPIF